MNKPSLMTTHYRITTLNTYMPILFKASQLKALQLKVSPLNVSPLKAAQHV